jgi:DnaJ-class molecular chaperone
MVKVGFAASMRRAASSASWGGVGTVAKTRDYYDVLGIPPRAHIRLVEESYWEQAHVLKNTPTRTAARKLKALNEAYEVLGTPHKRMKYDRDRAEAAAAERRSAHPGFLQVFVNLLGKPFRPD